MCGSRTVCPRCVFNSFWTTTELRGNWGISAVGYRQYSLVESIHSVVVLVFSSEKSRISSDSSFYQYIMKPRCTQYSEWNHKISGTSGSGVIIRLLTTLLQIELVASITATCLWFPGCIRLLCVPLCTRPKQPITAWGPEGTEASVALQQRHTDPSQREPAALKFCDKAKWSFNHTQGH